MGTPFGDSVLGGNDELVRNAIRSSNYGVDSEGVIQGWSINRNGSAEFHDVTIGNSKYSVDENGIASFAGISINGEYSDIVVSGITLQQILDTRPKGVVAVTKMATDTGAYTAGTPLVFSRIVIPNFDVTRQYKVCGIGRFNVASTTPAFVFLTVTARWDGDASATHLLLFNIEYARDSANSSDTADSFEFTFNGTDIGTTGTDLNLGFFVDANVSGLNYQGTTYGRVWVEDIGPAVEYQEYQPSGGGGTLPSQHVTTYNATWGCSYRGGGATCGSDFSRFNQGGVLYQGYYSSCNSDSRSWIGFDYSQVQSDLSGATINKCELYLNYEHWYFNGGGTAVIGSHNSSFVGSGDTGPGFNEALDDVDRLRVSGWARNAAKWVNLGISGFPTEMKNGTSKGVCLGPAPGGTDKIYYGHASDANSSHQPRLRFTYTK